MAKKYLGSRIIYIILSLLASVTLWVYVIYSESPDTETWVNNIPVTFVGEEALLEDRSLMIAEGADTRINLKLMGTRSDLSSLSKSNIVITVDLDEVTRSGVYPLSYEVTFPSTVKSENISILERSANVVRLTFSTLEKKAVEVHGVFTGEPAEGYMAGNVTCNLDTIEIRGAEELLAQVAYAQVTVDRTNVSRTITETLGYEYIAHDGSVLDGAGITCDIESIEATLPVMLTKEVKLTLDVLEGGGATSENLAYTISPEAIILSGDPEVLEGINQISLGSLDLSTIIADSTSIEYNIIIPNDSNNLSGIDTATVSVSLKGLERKVVRVTNIELINIPEGCTAELVTQSLQVLVRAPEDTIDLILANNIRVVADLSELASGKGQFEVPVKVHIDGYSDAGVVNDYTVAVSLADAAEAAAADALDLADITTVQ